MTQRRPSRWPPTLATWRPRIALSALGKDDDAVDVLSIEHLAPDWIRYQSYPRTITEN